MRPTIGTTRHGTERGTGSGTGPAPEHLRRRVPPQRLIDAVNPVVRWVIRSPLHALVDTSTLLLEVTGRSSGRRLAIPVSYADLGRELFVVTSHAWRRNLRGGADVQVVLHGRRRPMHAELTEAPGPVAQLLGGVIAGLGWRAARRTLGLRTTDGEPPTAADLRKLAATDDLAVITLTSDDTWRDGVLDDR